MGKSPNSCFKIISCGADSDVVDGDELSPPESKQSSDKHRWSFRKKSARHQVPSNTITSEPQKFSNDKEKSESTIDKFYSVMDSAVLEKQRAVEQAIAPLSLAGVDSEKTLSDNADEPTPLQKPPIIEQAAPPMSFVGVDSEKIPDEHASEPTSSFTVLLEPESPPFTVRIKEPEQLSADLANSEVEATPCAGKVNLDADANVQEKAAVVIQAATRSFLAKRELHKLKNLVKLQAAVRGHLVRKQAIGTLRCVQAIAKMQVLVRAHHARKCQLLESSGQEQKVGVKRNSGIKPNNRNSTVEKLVSNVFARQLLESNSKRKSIHVSRDPSRNDSTWQWLERWMAVTCSKEGTQKELSCDQEEKGRSKSADSELNSNRADVASLTSCLEFSPTTPAAADVEKDSTAEDKIEIFQPQAPQIISEPELNCRENEKKECLQCEENINMKEGSFIQTDSSVETYANGSQSTHDGCPSYAVSNTEKSEYIMRPSNLDPVDADGKKSEVGSRKIRNPAFAAVQAKFEELSSAPKSRSLGVLQESAIDCKHSQSLAGSVTKERVLNSTESSTNQNPVIQHAASECATEISISSTLDSPDRSETDGGEIVFEIRNSDDGMDNGSREAVHHENKEAEAKTITSVSDEYPVNRSQADNENVDESVASLDAVNVVQVPSEVSVQGNGDQPENLKAQVDRSLAEGSLRNNAAAPESFGTPSSQASVESKSSKTRNSVPLRKPKIKSGAKDNSPSNMKTDSDERNSAEQLPKDIKNANRRSSFGAAKLDRTETEPRHSSSKSLPSYMQATESARAKAHGGVSPKSSPDVHDKDNHARRRNSLPNGDEKQGSSPRIQRSASQPQQASKRNNHQSPQSSAERRWQR